MIKVNFKKNGKIESFCFLGGLIEDWNKLSTIDYFQISYYVKKLNPYIFSPLTAFAIGLHWVLVVEASHTRESV